MKKTNNARLEKDPEPMRVMKYMLNGKPVSADEYKKWLAQHNKEVATKKGGK